MSNSIFLETAMGDRTDRLDYWYFKEDMTVSNSPDIEASTEFVFPKGDVLLIRNYLQNEFGIWGYYDLKTPNDILRRYILLFDGDHYMADHRIVHI